MRQETPEEKKSRYEKGEARLSNVGGPLEKIEKRSKASPKKALVEIYIPKDTVLPAEIIYLVLDYSGLIRIGRHSCVFWLF